MPETSLSKKGYAVFKKDLDKSELSNIKKTMTVKPFINEDYGMPAEPFPIYLENKNKIYLPKYYGSLTYGHPNLIKMNNGLDISIKFNGSLRPNQEPVVKNYMDSIGEEDYSKQSNGGIISVGCGFGKTVLALYIASLLKKKTLVIVHKTFLLNQWKERIIEYIPNARIGQLQGTKMDIEDKDIVIGMLQSISMKDYSDDVFSDFGFTIIDECFPYNTLIHTDCGKICIGELHKNWKENKNLPNILSFNREKNSFEYKKMTYSWENERKDLIRVSLSKRKIICTPEHKILTINGYKEAKNLNNNDIVMCKYDDKNNEDIFARALNNDQLQIIYGSILGGSKLFITNNRYSMVINHNNYDTIKLIADVMKINTIGEVMMDNKKYYSIKTRQFDLIEKIPSDKKMASIYCINRINGKGISIWNSMNGGYYKYLNNLSRGVIKRKLNKLKMVYSFQFNRVIILNKLITEYKWDSNYLNYGTSRVTGKKYITNNTPYVYDIEVENNHNFIIAEKNRDNIDGPIVSNCHHIAAEVFSRALHKINSKYMLGLSATPKRKDGLSKVFEWFLGPYLFIQDSRSKKNIDLEVNTVHYNHDCEFYSKEETSYGGKVCIPKMITNITTFNRRTEIIYLLLERSVKQGRKILVLSDRRDHLKYLYEIVTNRELASIGYYIGGMKEVELKCSEDKQILLGTYAMSSEGMDIPSLNTLIMASPKGEIEQSVGRILRRKHEVSPIVYDIVDDFSVFSGQYFKRMKFYKKNNYTIYKTEIQDHDTMKKEELVSLLDEREEYVANKKKKVFSDIKVCLI